MFIKITVLTRICQSAHFTPVEHLLSAVAV